MAEKIATYTAKDLALKPTNAGYEAREMAGRRIGPFAEASARAIKEVADLNAKVVTELGAQQQAFLRFEGLEAKEGGGGYGAKYGGGLKDMFQLGAGGNEPNYARLNRLSELQDGPVRIADAARHIVNAQSPLTHGLQPQDAWDDPENYQINTGKNGVEPNAEPSRDDFEKQIQSDWSSNDSAWSPSQFGPSMVDRDSKGIAVGGNVGGSGGAWNAAKGRFDPVTGATNPAAPANWNQEPTDQTDFNQQQPDIPGGNNQTVPPPPPTNMSQWPTTGSGDVPSSPADNQQAPPFWAGLQEGF